MGFRDLVGIARQTDLTTINTTMEFYPPVKAEGISPERTLMEPGETTGVRAPMSAEYGTEVYKGSVEGNVRAASVGCFLISAFGDPDTTNPSGVVYQHVWDPLGSGKEPEPYTILTVNRDPDTAIVDAYIGCKVDTIEFAFDVDDYAIMRADFVAVDLNTAQTDPTETLDTSQRFSFDTIDVYVDSGSGYVEVPCSSANVVVNNNLKSDVFSLGETTLYSLDEGNLTGEIKFTPLTDFSTHYRRSQESDPTDCKFRVVATGALITGAYYYSLQFDFDLIQYGDCPVDIDAGEPLVDVEVTARPAYNTTTGQFVEVTLVNITTSYDDGVS